MTVRHLFLSESARRELLAHAREGADRSPPVEVCGVLGGVRAADEWRVTDARRVRNVADSPTVAYELDPAEAVAALDAVEDADRDVVGFYHSHPRGPDRPSDTDRRRATWPDHCYLIVSRPAADPDVGAWRWTGESFERLRIDSDGR